MAADSFARRLLAWWDVHGRKNLPWQQERTPYRIWVAEIMLQQTQVGTAAPYFERFVARFPDVEAVARADLDDVLHLWSGLGYYARARNLHRAAGIVVREHGGTLPDTAAALGALPGIGRSTAAAIVAQAHGRRAPILDGNVKRVLARRRRVAGPVSSTATLDELWRLAESHTPQDRAADYTQAVMDLGATVCRRRRPRCGDCPVRTGCLAFAAGDPERYPETAPRRPPPPRAAPVLRAGRPRRRLSRRAAAACRPLGRPLVAAGARRPRDGARIPRRGRCRCRPRRRDPGRPRLPPRLHPLRPGRRAGLRPPQVAAGRGSRGRRALDRPERPPAGPLDRRREARRRFVDSRRARALA